jgi:acetoin utilization protein AcuB
MNRYRRPPKEARPPIGAVARRLAALHDQLNEDPAATGDQALKLLEEYLENFVELHGFRGEGGLGRYVNYARDQQLLALTLLDQADAYVEARNCLAHTYGLQTSPALAAELIDFIELLISREGRYAQALMTKQVRTVNINERLLRVRDILLRDGFDQLPVVNDQGVIVGVLTQRDLVAIQAESEKLGQTFAHLTVADALPPDAIERIAIAEPDTPREVIQEMLRRPNTVVCLIMPHGQAEETPIGIITHSDLIYRL